MTRTITIAVYLVLLAAALVLTAIPHRRPEVLAPVSSLVDTIMDDPAARLTLLVFWWWLGWHFLAV